MTPPLQAWYLADVKPSSSATDLVMYTGLEMATFAL
ncbi:hypothetical protein PF002_g26168 [Phytophthora fragariae]|uniref:Uncharacterized protein n=1 Tax=Phytophthora fragariae TaxID=53985 RepID=A0A6A3WSJ0_9STRA|nr:hypothetical protein PF002_g26168 [Phytophthora fragariae]